MHLLVKLMKKKETNKKSSNEKILRSIISRIEQSVECAGKVLNEIIKYLRYLMQVFFCTITKMQYVRKIC